MGKIGFEWAFAFVQCSQCLFLGFKARHGAQALGEHLFIRGRPIYWVGAHIDHVCQTGRAEQTQELVRHSINRSLMISGRPLNRTLTFSGLERRLRSQALSV